MMILFFSLTSSAQQVIFEVTGWYKLDDGTFIVTNGRGESYRALPPEKMREVQITKQNLVLAEETLSSLRGQFDLYRKTSETERVASEDKFNFELKNAFDNRDYFKKQFEAENKLRVKFQKQMESCSGKIVFFRICTK